MDIELNCGTRMPRLALGTHRLRGRDALRRAIEPALARALRAAEARGGGAAPEPVHIDTASCYRNEAEIAGVLWDDLRVARGRVFLTTKCSPREMADVRAAVARSLAALRVDAIDLVLLHWPAAAGRPPGDASHAGARADAWRALESLRAEGAVRAIGVSNFERGHLLRLMDTAAAVPAVNQFEVHPLLARPELKVRAPPSARPGGARKGGFADGEGAGG